MTYPEFVEAILPRIHSKSVLKITLAIALKTDCGKQQARLTIAELMELTGLAKQSLLDGLTAAFEDGWIEREGSKRSFWYGLRVENLSEIGTATRPIRYENKTLKVRELDQTRYENKTLLSRKLDQTSEGVHLYKDKLASKQAETKIQTQGAFQKVAKAIKGNGVRLLVSQNFDFEGVVELWGESLPELWKRALRFSNRSSKDQPIYRFKDACERKLDLGLEPPTPQAPAKEPDENGIILGEIYWDAEHRYRVRPIDYKREWNLYAVEIPITPDAEPMNGRYDSIPPEFLQTYTPQCAA